MRAARYGGGLSRSVNAEIAEENNKLPLTRAIPVVIANAAALGVRLTRKDARAILIEAGSSEWHHVGKFANRVDYYATEVNYSQVLADMKSSLEYNTSQGGEFYDVDLRLLALVEELELSEQTDSER